MTPDSRRRLGIEVVVVLLVSLGQSAIYGILRIWEKMTRDVALSQQTTSMNVSQTPDRPWLDFAYQMAGTIFPLMPVLLVFYLLWVHERPVDGPFRSMGFDLRKPGKDMLWGFGIFMVIGVFGLAFYIAAVNMGINTQVKPANLAEQWWTVPILIARAVMNGVLEEVVMIGYLFTRWAQRGANMWVILVASAVIRGGYHLYQGWGGFIGNLVMGLIFGVIYFRVKRVMPLVIVHTLLDLFAFLGAGLLQYLPFAPSGT